MSTSMSRTLLVALLAAGLFGIFLLVGPNLTASSNGGAAPTPDPTPSTLTTAPVDPASTTTTAPRISPSGPEEWDPARMTPANGYDGSIAIRARHESPEGGDTIGDGDEVLWEVTVTNMTEGRLWGVFAWVEGFGRAYCDDKILDPGESTACFAANTAYWGRHDIVAWANAWTLHEQVKDKVLAPIEVDAWSP